MEEEPRYDSIEEVKSLQLKRANKEFMDVVIVVFSNAFYVFNKEQLVRGEVNDLVQKKEFVHKITYAEVTDIIFPSFKKIAKRLKNKDKGVPFKIITSSEEYWVWVTEKYFWISRKLFENTLYIQENVS